MRRTIARLFGLQVPEDAAPVAAQPKSLHDQPRPISETALAAVRARAGRDSSTSLVARDHVPAESIFSTALSRPPGVPDSAPTMASDSALEARSAWGGSQLQALNSQFLEGVSFLGYAYLAELAQRAENRMMVETISSEMTRRGIRFVAKTDEDDEDDEAAPGGVDVDDEAAEGAEPHVDSRITELENEFRRLRIMDGVRKALDGDGFFGRGHLYLDTGDTMRSEELITNLGDGWDRTSAAKVDQRSPLLAVRPVEAVWCYPTDYDSNDPLTEDWYNPEIWYVQARRVHRSRLITIISRPVPDLLKPTYSFGGLSLTQMAKPYVDNWLETRQSVNDILTSFTTWVLKTNLQSTLMGDGGEMFKRAEIFTAVKNLTGVLLVDGNEEFSNVSAPLAGLGELQVQAQEQMASVSHIPTVKLLGIQPAGLNADSEGVLRSFYDWIAATQERVLRDPIKQIVGLVMLSLWGEVDENIDFEFEPLWSLDEKDIAEVQDKKATTDQKYVDMGAISPYEVRRRIAGDPDSGHDDLDLDDMPDLQDEEAGGLVPDVPDGGEVAEAEARLDLEGA